MRTNIGQKVSTETFLDRFGSLLGAAPGLRTYLRGRSPTPSAGEWASADIPNKITNEFKIIFYSVSTKINNIGPARNIIAADDARAQLKYTQGDKYVVSL